jgi:hypothetical protein
MTKILSKNDLLELSKQLATPIDFNELEKKGIIEKKGSWFKVIRLNALPEHASRQVRNIKTDGKGNYYVQFPTSWKKAQQLYQRMTEKAVLK